MTTFQFTHPGKGATERKVRIVDWSLVSIHAPWEGCDLVLVSLVLLMQRCFNSRTLGRVRPVKIIVDFLIGKFQFTHPGKGATYP